MKLASLSARRAWIEILAPRLADMSSAVALRKESVDRNRSEEVSYSIIVKSLSARRAWIEIFGGASARLLALSSLSARRAWIEI